MPIKTNTNRSKKSWQFLRSKSLQLSFADSELFEGGPVIKEPLKAIHIEEKSDFELSVAFENVDDSNVQWYHNNQPLEQNDTCMIKTEKGRSTIKISDANKKKVGKYEVVIEKDNKLVKSGSSVKLHKPSEEEEILPPSFTELLRPTAAQLGAPLLLQTAVRSLPVASFTWFLGNREIKQFASENKLDDIYVTTENNASCLYIESLREDALGTITCRAENFAGSVSCSASLAEAAVVTDAAGCAPTVRAPLEQVRVMDGDTIELECAFSGSPAPRVHWHRDGGTLLRARDLAFGRWADGLCHLTVREAFPEMTGTYRCTATNDYGSCATECHVTVEGTSRATACRTMQTDSIRLGQDLDGSVEIKHLFWQAYFSSVILSI